MREARVPEDQVHLIAPALLNRSEEVDEILGKLDALRKMGEDRLVVVAPGRQEDSTSLLLERLVHWENWGENVPRDIEIEVEWPASTLVDAQRRKIDKFISDLMGEARRFGLVEGEALNGFVMVRLEVSHIVWSRDVPVAQVCIDRLSEVKIGPKGFLIVLLCLAGQKRTHGQPCDLCGWAEAKRAEAGPPWLLVLREAKLIGREHIRSWANRLDERLGFGDGFRLQLTVAVQSRLDMQGTPLAEISDLVIEEIRKTADNRLPPSATSRAPVPGMRMDH